MAKEFQYLKSDIYEEQQSKVSKPIAEAYDPNADDTFMPYMPSRGGAQNRYQPQVPRGAKPGQFIDIDKISQYANNQEPEGYGSSTSNRYQSQLAQMESLGGGRFNPNEDVAEQNLERMNQILKKTTGLIGSTSENDEDLENYAIKVALKSIDDCLQTLNDIEEWLPKGKQGYAKQLKTGASPILKALNLYRGAIEKIS